MRLQEDDVSKILMAEAHLGTKNVNHQMEPYIFKRRGDCTYIFNIHKMWEKILLAARVITAVENPKDVCAISGRPYGQRAVLKFAAHVGATPVAGRFTPGTFTNQIQRAFKEPRLLVVTDPHTDHQPIAESCYVNIPVIAFCNSDSHLKYIDIAIPCNNKAVHSIGLIWWFLSREVLRLRGTIRDREWDVMPDLYFYRDPEEVEKEEQAAIQGKEEPAGLGWDAAAPEAAAADDWAAAPAPGGFQAPAAGGFAAPAGGDDWSSNQDWNAPGGQDWSNAN